MKSKLIPIEGHYNKVNDIAISLFLDLRNKVCNNMNYIKDESHKDAIIFYISLAEKPKRLFDVHMQKSRKDCLLLHIENRNLPVNDPNKISRIRMRKSSGKEQVEILLNKDTALDDVVNIIKQCYEINITNQSSNRRAEMSQQFPSNKDSNDNYGSFKMKREIRTQASDPIVKNLCDRIDKGKLKIQADFQRKYVWESNNKLKSKLIESVFFFFFIPTIYTAEEEDGSEVVIDGQQRLQTFHSFLKNQFRLTGLEICFELNHKSYQSLGDIDESLQDKITNYPLRVIKIMKDSDDSVKFDIFERLNRGSVKLTDQELRNCIYRGKFNTFLKELVKTDQNFQILLGSKDHKRMQDIEFALRFFALYEWKYKSPMKKFINIFMKENQDIEDDKLREYRTIFKKSAMLVITVFGKNAFNLYTHKHGINGIYEKKINKGLFDVLMNGFTLYNSNQIMPYKDALKEELIWLMTQNDDFLGAITGSGTDSHEKVTKKLDIWINSIKTIIGSPKVEPRCFSWELKNELWKNNPVCMICKQQIESVDDAEVDHIEFYWRGGKTIPENARLTHRYCNRSRKLNEQVILRKNN